MATRCLRLFVVLLLTVLVSSSSYASILLKPKGADSLRLLTKSVKADVIIDRQIATTDLVLVFHNETQDRMEADFIYTIPPGAVVTHFAYWYGDEKVAARVVEKQRAAEIYQAITSRMRDPALIELVGKNLFRARIFPVMPNSDLKIEIVYVQALQSDKDGVTYKLPLSDTGKEKNALSQIDINIKVKADRNIDGVVNNLGIPVGKNTDGWNVSFSGTNYRPQKDISVRLNAKKKPLRTALYAARSGGVDGFFAIALTPDHSLVNPKVHIAGVQTYSVVPSSLSSVKANMSLVLFGRYKGSGVSTVTLEGISPDGKQTYQDSVIFGSKSEPNNPATKLWAASQIEQLGKNRKSKSAITKLSMRYTIPSAFTSWLAIPNAERKRFAREINLAEILSLGKQLTIFSMEGKENTPKARGLKHKFHSMCKNAGIDPKLELDIRFCETFWTLCNQWVDMVATGHSKSTSARWTRNLIRLAAGSSRYKDCIPLQEYLSNKIWYIADQQASEQLNEKPNARRIASLQIQLSRLANVSKLKLPQIKAKAREIVYLTMRDDLAKQAYWEMSGSSPDKNHIAQLKSRIKHLNTRINGKKYAAEYDEYVEWTLQRSVIEKKFWDAHRDAEYDDIDLQKQLKDHEKNRNPSWERFAYRWGDPLISIEAPADAQQVAALMPDGEIKTLNFNPDTGRWEARFDIPIYAKQSTYTIKVIIVLKDGTRRVVNITYSVDTTPPGGKATAELADTGGSVLRLDLEADTDTARAAAVLPWQERIDMKPSDTPGKFFALVSIPKEYAGKNCAVTFILTDSAHNRTLLTVDTSQ